MFIIHCFLKEGAFMRQKVLFTLSATCYSLSSASVLLMGIGDMSGENGSVLVAIICALIFWISLLTAIVVQLILQHNNKPYKRKIPLKEMAFTMPTVCFEVGFLISFIAISIFTMLNINGFVVFLLLFLLLACFELSILTMGKFQKKDGKTVLLLI